MSVYARENRTDRLPMGYPPLSHWIPEHTLIYCKHTYTTEGARAMRLLRIVAFAFFSANFYIQQKR